MEKIVGYLELLKLLPKFIISSGKSLYMRIKLSRKAKFSYKVEMLKKKKKKNPPPGKTEISVIQNGYRTM